MQAFGGFLYGNFGVNRENTMYRKASSGRFIGLTTFLIVVVMAVFTWVMYGMALQVFKMTDIMIELNESIKTMVGSTVSMASDMHQMNTNMVDMNASIASMDVNMASMDSKIGTMSESMAVMSNDFHLMNASMNKMTYDVGQATYAFSNPMSYMWGNPFPF